MSRSESSVSSTSVADTDTEKKEGKTQINDYIIELEFTVPYSL